jgi:hypothetical protein
MRGEDPAVMSLPYRSSYPNAPRRFRDCQVDITANFDHREAGLNRSTARAIGP